MNDNDDNDDNDADDAEFRGCTVIILVIGFFLALLYLASVPDLAAWVRRILN